MTQAIATEKRTTRSIQRIIHGMETSDGAGVNLRRYIASPELDMLDPFLLLDVFSSKDADDYIAGFPPHPHRGFETVTYLLAGRMRHRDSAGHEGVIQAGGVQWMTAGSGIEHSEMPEQEDGLLAGFQLWVNLPAAKKMMPPRYQELEPGQIPVESLGEWGHIRVIAGTTTQGTTGPVNGIAAAPLYLDVQLNPGASLQQDITAGHHAFLYAIEGALTVDGSSQQNFLQAGQLAVLDDGDTLQIHSLEGCRILLVAGQPFGEPVARYGPFVMNTEQELRQAFVDYRSGQFGHIEEVQ